MRIGGWTGKVSEVSPDDTKELHRKDDVDFDSSSHHHTIGDGPNQAASGAVVKQLGSTGDVKLTFAEPDNVVWFALGETISRTGTSAALFALFGTTFGAGDGSTTFKLPDPSDRVLRLLGAGSSEEPGDVGGDNTRVITTANLPPHVHAGAVHSHPAQRRAAVGSVATGFARGAGALEPDDNTGNNTAGNTGNGGFANDPVDVTNEYFGLRALIHA